MKRKNYGLRLQNVNKLSRFRLGIVALSFALVGGLFAIFSHAEAAYYIAPGGNNSNACTQSLPCASISRAYQLAGEGDIIKVAAGNYGRQELLSGTKSVIIEAENGVTPVFGTTTISASNLTIRGINITRNDDPGPYTATLEAQGDNLIFDGVNVDSKQMMARQGIYANGNNNRFLNGSTHDVLDEKAALVTGQNITFDNFNFYNAIFQQTGDVHMECVYAIGADGLTVKNSKFWNCSTMDMMLTRGSWYNAPVWGNITIENNVFAHSTNGEGQNPAGWHYYGLLFSGALSYDGQAVPNVKVRYNTFENTVNLDDPVRITGASEFVGNLGNGWACFSSIVYKYNVGTKCSASDKSAASSDYKFINPGSYDFHIAADSAARDAGDPSDYPASDKDGNSRPAGSAPDAGAYEYGGVTGGGGGGPPPDTTPPTVTLTSPSNGDTVSVPSVNLAANASDNVGVSSVQFLVNGQPVGQPDTTAPYTAVWNTSQLANGTYLISARATDTASNTATTNAATVTLTGALNPSNFLMAEYGFSENSGTTATDRSGHNATLSLTNTAWTSNGKFGSALDFNGTTSVASTPDSATLDLSSQGAMEAWVKVDSINKWQGIIAKGNANSNEGHNYAIEINSSNQFVCILGNGSTSLMATSSTLVTTNTFYHVACSWDGTSVKLYVNTMLEQAVSQSITPSANNSPLYIGVFGATFDHTSGIIDNVRIFSTPLTQSQITSNSTTPVDDGATSPPPTDSVAPTVSITSPTASAIVSGSNVSITASANDNVGVVGVSFKINGNSLGGEDNAAPYNAVLDTTTMANGTYTLTAVARDAAGNSATSSGVSITINNSPPPDSTPPSAPGNLTSSSQTNNSVTLNWIASTDNVGVTGYEIYRNGNLVTSTTEVTYVDINLIQDTSYTYSVKAYDALHNVSAASNSLTVKTLNNTSPAAKANFINTGTSANRIDGKDLSYLLFRFGRSDTDALTADIVTTGDSANKVNGKDLSFLLFYYGTNL